jgi:hypothetical protein
MADAPKHDTLWSHVLHKVGLSEQIKRFRFGGFVGKLCIFGATVVVAIAAVALKLHDQRLLLTAIGIMAVLGFYVVYKVSSFADKHPELAMFEGAEILQWEQIKLAAKGVSTPVLGIPVPEPNKQLSASDTSGGETK